MSSATFRRAAPDDADALSRLVCSLGDYFLADPDRPDDARQFFEDMTPEATHARLENPDFQGFVAEADEAIVGMIIMFQARHLYQLFVEPDWHRQGLARTLWTLGREDSEARGNEGVFTVNASLYAIPVYERFGFRQDGETIYHCGLAYLPMIRDAGPD